MKRFLTIVAFIAAMLVGTNASAQGKLPNDPSVKVGKLKNGLTYYVKANKKPANRAEFYIVTHAGAILETPDQDGLAHFLEHMCFNGTQNFPDKKLLEYCQSIGAEFGRNVNASTGFEQTIYMLNNMPVNRPEIIDSSLLILHDYAHFVLAEQEEIDNERGVILEERRTRRNAQWRTFEKSREVMWGPGTAYATHTLIGEEEQLKTFKRESLLTYYHTWYQPCNQAIIVVGDINEDDVIARITRIFSDIPGGVIPAKPYVGAAPNDTPRIGVFTDPETPTSTIEIGFHQQPIPGLEGTDVGFMFQMTQYIMAIVMQERFTEITSKINAPLQTGSIGVGSLCEQTEVLMGNARFKDGAWEPAFRTLMTELEKMRRYGFDDQEVERAKDRLLAMFRMMAQGADTRENADFIDDLVANFTQGEAYCTPQVMKQLAENLLPQITAPMIQNVMDRYLTDPQTGALTTKNIFVVYSAPDKEGLTHPTKEQIAAVIDIVRDADISRNATAAITTDLMAGLKIKGSKVAKTEQGLYGTTVWTLKNGVKVYVKPTDFAKDEVNIQTLTEGGKSLISDKDLVNFDGSVMSFTRRNAGISTFDQSTLNKMLAGKNVNVSPFIDEFYQGVNAFSTPDDIETALQLVALNYLAPRFNEEDFQNGIDQIRGILANQVNNPQFAFSTKLYDVLYGGDARHAALTPEKLETVNFEAFVAAYRSLFSTFVQGKVIITGNVDLKKLKPLVEKYIGAIPAAGEVLAKNVRPNKIVEGEVISHSDFPMETLKSTVCQIAYVPCQYTVAKAAAAYVASQILNMVYVDTLRESEGGTYGASAQVSLSHDPYGALESFTYFDTNVEQAASLEAIAREQFRILATNGPTEQHYNQAVEIAKKQIPENLIKNSFWGRRITDWVKYGVENYVEEWQAALDAMTPEQIKAIFSEILSSGNFIEIEIRGIAK